MSYAEIARAAEGVSVLADANDEAQLIGTEGVISLATVSFGLYENFDKKLAEDANTIFADSSNPDDPGQVGVDQAIKEIDTQQSDKANGIMNTVIEGSKEQLQVLGNNLTQVFSMIEPIKQVLAFFTGVIAKKF